MTADVIAGAQGVRKRRFPGAGAGGRVDHHGMPGLEDLLDALQNPQAQHAELRAAVVDGRIAHRAQDAVGHRGRTGDLQEVAAGGVEVEGDHGFWLVEVG